VRIEFNDGSAAAVSIANKNVACAIDRNCRGTGTRTAAGIESIDYVVGE
jgi:hypothetical protein